MTTDRPAPPSEGLAGAWFAWQAAGELRLQRCRSSATWIHPPQHFCPACGSNDLSWEPVSGRGTVFTWTVTHRPFDPAFADEVPYVCAVVELAEGPRVFSMLREVAADDVHVGMAVRAAFEPRAGAVTVAVFVPDRG